MLEFSSTSIKRLSITWVGNKNRYEGVQVPKTTLVPVHDFAHEVLISTFLKPFEKQEEFFYFHHEEDVSNNRIYQACMNIFADQDTMSEQATQITQILYECALSPKVNGGEFFVAYFDEVLLGGEPCAAIGIFKIQTKDSYLKVERTADSFALNVIEGIPTGKLETAALIFNVDETEGYRVCAIDSVSKKDELSFVKDDFLKIRPIEDSYFNTRHYITMASEFITQQAPRKLNLDRADQIDLLNRSADYFKDNEYFEVDDFAGTLFPEEEQQEAFKEFRDEYAKANVVPLEDKFDISGQAVKKQAKVFKSVIKLDKNFHIYVHGRRDLIEKGFDDDKGKKYYKVFFEDEE
jgi:hypothetical protein